MSSYFGQKLSKAGYEMKYFRDILLKVNFQNSMSCIQIVNAKYCTFST